MTDAQHNVTAMVAENGQVVERYAYDPYGRVIVLNGENDPDGAEYTPDADGLSDVGNVILYAGYRFDAAAGLYHVRHRYHHPTLGRWINRDPKGYVDGMNLYQYVASRPMAATDPMGLEGVMSVAKGLMAAVNPTYAVMEYNKWVAKTFLGDSKVERTVKTAAGAMTSISSGEAVVRPLTEGLKEDPVRIVSSLYVGVNPIYDTYSFCSDFTETHSQYIESTDGSGASTTDQAVGAAVIMLSEKTGVLGLSESFIWEESFSGEALSQDEKDLRAASGTIKLTTTAYVATQGLKVAGQGMKRMGSCVKARLAPNRGLSIAARQEMVAGRTAEHVALRSQTAAALRQARATGMTPSLRTQLRGLSGRLGWAEEAQLVRMTGQGTRAWSAGEMTELLQTGRVAGYSPHHINSVRPYEWMAGNANNIRFVERWTEHGVIHGGNTLIPAEGPLINRSQLMIDALMGR